MLPVRGVPKGGRAPDLYSFASALSLSAAAFAATAFFAFSAIVASDAARFNAVAVAAAAFFATAASSAGAEKLVIVVDSAVVGPGSAGGCGTDALRRARRLSRLAFFFPALISLRSASAAAYAANDASSASFNAAAFSEASSAALAADSAAVRSDITFAAWLCSRKFALRELCVDVGLASTGPGVATEGAAFTGLGDVTGGAALITLTELGAANGGTAPAVLKDAAGGAALITLVGLGTAAAPAPLDFALMVVVLDLTTGVIAADVVTDSWGEKEEPPDVACISPRQSLYTFIAATTLFAFDASSLSIAPLEAAARIKVRGGLTGRRELV